MVKKKGQLEHFIVWSFFVIVELALANTLWVELNKDPINGWAIAIVLGIMYVILPKEWKPRIG